MRVRPASAIFNCVGNLFLVGAVFFLFVAGFLAVVVAFFLDAAFLGAAVSFFTVVTG